MRDQRLQLAAREVWQATCIIRVCLSKTYTDRTIQTALDQIDMAMVALMDAAKQTTAEGAAPEEAG